MFFTLEDDILFRNDGNYIVFYRYKNGSLSFYVLDKTEIALLPLLLLKEYEKSIHDIEKIIPSSLINSVIKRLENFKIIKKSNSLNNNFFAKNIKIVESINKIKDYKTDISRFNLPLLVGLNFTNRCNFNCQYCYAERKKTEEIETNQWFKIIDDIDRCGIKVVDIVGADLFSRSDAVKIIKYMDEKKFIFSISTKSLITEKMANVFSNLKNKDHITFQISLDSYKPQTVYKLTLVPDSYIYAITSIKNLIKAGIYPRVKSVISKYNLKDINGFVKKMSEIGVREIAFVAATKSYYKNNTHLVLNEDEIKEVGEEINNIKDKYSKYSLTIYWQDAKVEKFKSYKEWENRPLCSAGRSSLIILPNGDISICEQMPYKKEYIFGNILKNSINEIWNSKKLLSFIYPDRKRFKKNSICYSCNYFDDCNVKGRCFRDAFFSYSTPFDAPPYCFKRHSL